MRRLGKGDVIGEFGKRQAYAFTLFERLEESSRSSQYPGQLTRAAVELAKDSAHRPLPAAAS